MAEHDHSAHQRMNRRLLWAGGIGSGLVLAPYVLPHLGIGTTKMASDIALLCGSGYPYGTGIAGAINGGLATVPGIGESLAAGGWATAVTSGVIGLGGALLGRYVSKHYDKPGHIPWGKVIRYVSLATSVLIALPSVLSGISMGITFLALALGGVMVASQLNAVLASTLGFMGTGSMATATAGFSGLLPHLLTCGVSALPAVGSAFLGHSPSAGAPHMRLVHADPMRVGQPCTLAFQLNDANGKPLKPDALKTVHTKQLHTMLVDSSLTDYHHLHPLFDAASGLFTCQFTPRSTQGYTAWHDLTLTRGGQHYLSNALPGRSALRVPASIRHTSQAEAQGITAAISSPTPLCAGKNGTLNIQLTQADGLPVTDLQPIMGAAAHLVGFTQDGSRMIHCHPIGESTGGKLSFHITPELAGGTKFFLQIKRNGQEVVVPFGQFVQMGQQFTARPRAAETGHAHHGMAAA